MIGHVKRFWRLMIGAFVISSLVISFLCISVRAWATQDSSDVLEFSSPRFGQIAIDAEKQQIVFGYLGNLPQEGWGLKYDHWSDGASGGNGDLFTNLEAEISYHMALAFMMPSTVSRFGGIVFVSDLVKESPQRPRVVVLLIPIWYPVAGFGLTPLLWIVTHIRKSSRRISGTCLSCGYDLRATPDRCPECGKIAEKVI